MSWPAEPAIELLVQALVQARYGAPGSLARLRTLETRELQSQELRLAVLAAPIHPVDQLRARGLYPLPLPLPGILGSEGVARVVELGPDSDRLAHPWKVGDLCLLPLRIGSYRSELNLPAKGLLPLPPGLDPLQASMLLINPLSAELMLDRSGLRPGDAFLNLPASGAVGQCLLSLAKSRGLRSINLYRNPSWQPWLQSLDPRAELVLLKEAKVPESIGGARYAFDGVGGQSAASLGRALRPGGGLCSYGALSRAAPCLSVQQLIFRNITLSGFWLHHWMNAQPKKEIQTKVDKLAQKMLKGELKIKVAQTFPLEEYCQAFAAAKDPQLLGRILFCPTQGATSSSLSTS